MSREPLLTVKDLAVRFPIREGLVRERTVAEVRAVDGVSFEVAKGEILGLVGESGCGKSTVARAVTRVVKPNAGTIDFDGHNLATAEGSELHELRRRVQMIFQDPYASLNPRMTVGAILREPADIYNVGTSAERTGRVAELLELVGLDPRFAERYPHEFSGGQRQRIGVARALALNPDLVVADEPVSALDVSVQAQILNLLAELRQRLGLAYLFIAHDLSVVRHISDRTAVMYLGKIVEVAPSAELNSSPVHPYSIALLSAVPIPDPAIEKKRKRIILKGDVPSPSNPPSGCAFQTRCWLKEKLGNPERCSTESPQLVQVSTGHQVACHFPDKV